MSGGKNPGGKNSEGTAMQLEGFFGGGVLALTQQSCRRESIANLRPAASAARVRKNLHGSIHERAPT
jgi:hypothetical protein